MMRDMTAIYRKEMRAYFTSPIPYLFAALFAGFMAWRMFFYKDTAFWVLDKAELGRGFFDGLELWLIVLVSAIGMSRWTAEIDGGTIETLLTLPLKPVAMVLGKFLAAWTLVGICLVATASIPVTVSSLGDMDWGPVLGGYLGAMLFSGAMLAVGVWISSLTRHQIVAFILTIVIGLAFMGMYEIAEDAGRGLGSVLEQLSVVSHYQSMGRGVVDVRDVAWFVSVIAFFLYLNTQSVENRRYR